MADLTVTVTESLEVSDASQVSLPYFERVLQRPVYILDTDDKVVAALSNHASDACPFTADVMVQKLGAYATFQFEVPLDHRDTEFLVCENQVAFLDHGCDFLLFTIKRTDEVVTDSDRRLKVFCEHAATELNNHIIRPVIFTDTADDILDGLLTDTRWEAGDVEDVSTSQTYSWQDYPTVLKSILTLGQVWELEPRFRVDLHHGKIQSRYVDLLIQQGEETYKVFEYAKDLQGVAVTQDSAQVVTAMVGLGANVREGDFITFEDVVWTTPSNPADKPAAQDWVGDEDARALYGMPTAAGDRAHVFSVYQNPNQNDEQQLLQDTWNALQEVKEPKVTYDCDAVLIDRLPPQYPTDKEFCTYDHEQVRLGDTVYVKDFTFDPPLGLEARVVQVQRSLTESRNDRVTLGEYRRLVVDAVDPRDVELWVYSGVGSWLGGETMVIAASDSAEKNRADLVCDGTDDWEDIQEAIDYFGDLGKSGRIILLDGTFAMGGYLRLTDSDYITLEGQGPATILEFGGATYNDITADNITTEGFCLKNLTLDALDYFSCYMGTDWYFENVLITAGGSYDGVLSMPGGSQKCSFVNCTFPGGVNLNSLYADPERASQDIRFKACTIGNKNTGTYECIQILRLANRVMFDHCYIVNADDYRIGRLDDDTGTKANVSFRNCMFETGYTGAMFLLGDGVTDFMVTGCDFSLCPNMTAITSG